MTRTSRIVLAILSLCLMAARGCVTVDDCPQVPCMSADCTAGVCVYWRQYIYSWADGICIDYPAPCNSSTSALCGFTAAVPCRTATGGTCPRCAIYDTIHNGLGNYSCVCFEDMYWEPLVPCYYPATSTYSHHGLCSGGPDCVYECYTTLDCYTNSHVPCLNALCLANHTCAYFPCPNNTCVNGSCNECVVTGLDAYGHWFYGEKLGGNAVYYPTCSGGNCVFGDCIACDGGTVAEGGCNPVCQIIHVQRPLIDRDNPCYCTNNTSPCPTGICEGGICVCRNDTDCEHLLLDTPCAWANCTNGTCAIGTLCNETMCDLSTCNHQGICYGVCVACYFDGDCQQPERGSCQLAYCDVSVPEHSCYTVQYDERHCINGTVQVCVDPQIDCNPGPCEIYGCTEDTHVCILLDACPVGHCFADNVTCARCLDPAVDCSMDLCQSLVANCTANHTCVSMCQPDRRCNGNGVCVLHCTNATTDCAPQVCRTRACNSDHECSWPADPTQRCTLDPHFPNRGFCDAQGACVACLGHPDCVQSGCWGECVAGRCSFDCTVGCVHAIGWWYKNAASAFPPYAPFTLPNTSITVSSPSALRDILRGAYDSDALTSLEAMLLVVELNRAASSAMVQALAVPMASATEILSVCQPDHSTWAAMLGTGSCHGFGLSLLPPLIEVLARYSNGELGVPICPDIGAHT